MATLRARELFSDTRHRLISVESIDVHETKSARGCRLFVFMQSLAVIVCSPDKTYALDMAAQPADLEHLIQTVPELESMIEGYEN
jgi:hypothetical protein